jgi:hypothetical protein
MRSESLEAKEQKVMDKVLSVTISLALSSVAVAQCRPGMPCYNFTQPGYTQSWAPEGQFPMGQQYYNPQFSPYSSPAAEEFRTGPQGCRGSFFSLELREQFQTGPRYFNPYTFPQYPAWEAPRPTGPRYFPQ